MKSIFTIFIFIILSSFSIVLDQGNSRNFIVFYDYQLKMNQAIDNKDIQYKKDSIYAKVGLSKSDGDKIMNYLKRILENGKANYILTCNSKSASFLKNESVSENGSIFYNMLNSA